MNKKLAYIILATLISQFSYAISQDQLNTDYQLYQAKDKTQLFNQSQSNPSDIIANYLAALDKINTDTSYASAFINKDPMNPLALSLAHKVLTKDYGSQNWNEYLKISQVIDSKQLSQNEICGQNLAKYMLNQAKVEDKYLASTILNKMPDRCASLIATLATNNQLPKKYLIPALYNLLTHNQVTQYNQIASANNIPNYQLTNTNQPTKYQLVYQISQLAIKNPDIALSKLEQAQTDKFTKQYLYNFVATRLAIKQMFDLALTATNRGHDVYLSNDQFEWKVRIYLFNQKWYDALETIKAMHESLKEQDKWLYWKAYAYRKLGHDNQAVATLKKISNKPVFYSLLAKSEIGDVPTIPVENKSISLNKIKYYNYAKLGFDLYQAGTKFNIPYYKNLATFVLYKTAGYSNDTDLLSISDYADNLGMNDVSIYAATKMNNVDIRRAFPTPYLDSFTQAANENGIPVTVPLAITRQESRFNKNALAFDGGVGLMQLMPQTAKYISKKLGVSADCYKTYQCNIREGTWFVASLYRKFGSNLIYASAGYNAGPGRAHRWEKAFYGLDNQLQTELVPFDITRAYTQQITTNQLVYEALINKKPLNMADYLKQINNKDKTFVEDDDNTDGNSPQATDSSDKNSDDDN